jgi:L-ascorbate metabolism protein UlaG (beta-lactamase superfamily)
MGSAGPPLAPSRSGRGVAALHNLRDVLAYAATRGRHDRTDAEVAAEIVASPRGLDLPDGLELTWLGVAGIGLAYGGTRLLIDPYVTRLPVGDLLRRRVVAPDADAIGRHLPPADAVLLGHTHFDHALDAPAIAARDGCPVYGGASAATLMGLHGLAAQAVEVEPHRVYEIGPFEVTFVPSVHSRLVLGLSVPNGGEITCEHVEGLTPQSYCCGQVWGIHISVAGRTFYHQGSADLIDDEVRHRDVDYFLCGIAGRQVTDRYVDRVLGRLQPHRVLVLHQDDFFRPLDAPTGFAFGVDVARFPEEVAAVARDVPVMTLPLLDPLTAVGARAE